jgi:hypothetical protein
MDERDNVRLIDTSGPQSYCSSICRRSGRVGAIIVEYALNISSIFIRAVAAIASKTDAEPV